MTLIRRTLIVLLLCSTGGCASRDDLDLPPAGQVDIYRDDFGVPHIFASREEDAYYALGYAQAEDRLTATLAVLLAVEGRSASVFGHGELPWSGSALQADREALRWRIAEEARKGYERLTPRLQRQLSAHAAGFRNYLKTHPEEVPEWAPRVEPWHALAWPQLLLWGFNAGDGLRECAAEGIKLALWATESQFASNEWAVAPARTSAGRTILLSDPHGPIPRQGNPFYEYRMKSGDLDVTGFALGALPALAHSSNVAWGLTTGGPDVSDCYRLRLNPDARGRYWIHGEEREFERREVEIEVEGADPVKVTFEDALINGHRAPVVGRDDAHAYAVVTPYISALEALHAQFDAMIRADSASEVLEAAGIQGMFPQNLLIADSGGEIIYLRGGRTPVRSSALDWDRAVSGDNVESRWRGVHSLSDLVVVRNPDTGYIQNANTPPDNMTAGEPLVEQSDYPAYIWNDNPAVAFFARAGRLNSVLDANDRLTVDAAIALALDQHWFGAEKWTALLAAAAEARPDAVSAWSEETQQVMDRLLRFDGRATDTSKGALAHYFWRSALLDGVESSQLADLLAGVDTGTPSEQATVAALAAVPAATELMKRETGSADLAYGDWFRIGASPERHYPIGGGVSLETESFARCRSLQVPSFGCAVTLRAFIHGYETADGRPLVSHGSRALRLVVLGEPLVTYSLYLFGQSDNPGSPHRDDQARDLASPAELKRVPFTMSELAAQEPTYLRLSTRPPSDRQ